MKILPFSNILEGLIFIFPTFLQDHISILITRSMVLPRMRIAMLVI